MVSGVPHAMARWEVFAVALLAQYLEPRLWAEKRCGQEWPLNVGRMNDLVATSGLADLGGAVDYGPGGGSDSILMSTAPTATRWA